MSLYASIDVPKDEKTAPKRPGFVPLYSDPATVPPEPPIPKQALAEQGSVAQEPPNAALQFAPSLRRKVAPPAKRKAALLSDASAQIQDADSTSSDSLKPGSNVPRLEVINNFEDYADYHPNYEEPEDNSKKTKKPKRKALVSEPLGWDDEYDPSRPIEFEHYLGSEEQQQARAEWQVNKAELGFGKAGSKSSAPESDKRVFENRQRKLNFGPPAKMKLNFAPVIAPNVYRAPASATEQSRLPSPPPAPVPGHVPLPPSSTAHIPPPPPPVETAEEAYARRSATHFGTVPSIGSSLTQRAPGTFQAPPPPPSQRISYSAAPTFNANSMPQSALHGPDNDYEHEDSNDHADIPAGRGSAPGQKDFAQRYMASQGWSKGQGLGSSGTGRLAPLFVKPQKDGKTGKIIDRHRKSSKNASASSQMSKVVLLEGMIKTNEVIDEFLQQDVGESCADAYGKVERVKLVSETGRVLVKFTDAISALRCMSTVEGREFQGTSVAARYYPEDAFEAGDWTK